MGPERPLVGDIGPVGSESGDHELLAAQDALQAEADAVLTDLDLLEHIRRLGDPVRTGSSVLGLMVRRDIDVTTLCPSLELPPIFHLGRTPAGPPRGPRP